MRLVHEPATDGDSGARRSHETLASTVDIADSIVSQTRGLMFRRSLPDEYALAFRFESTRTRDLHTLFVFVPIDAVWVVDGVVQRVETLRPWRGFAREKADLIVELPAGTAADVEPGDRLRLEDG
ncbi:DUF192 domain-containing protein [Natrinema longum]|uniref:DUF192 domain-containing protein n=1 Tax=Natrinema longum TaxID=370324 RepID=A0A8A2UBU5_9EURY|nr:DUF192 domain-containing protein [Natrinema longum]MBZ6495893.1 DUF192 domain-containing protein [Natrinema longum]QSW86166.1 DUF192 domain-containing protein [Natrinema longum]